jgi:pimeloyl-ACP methyl ester carboxylesterase
LTATLDLLEASGLYSADLVGASFGATLAAEVAAFSRSSVRRLVLIAPFGLFDEREPVRDLWATRPNELPELLSKRPDALAAFLAAPEGEDAVEWSILLARASEAAARLLWPIGDLGLRKRLHRVQAPTLVLWGAEDRILPPSYAKRFSSALGGWVEVREIADAGHMAELDQPEAVAAAIEGFLA